MMDPSERQFALHKARAVMENAAANLRSAADVPYAVTSPTGERAGTFVVVGAGPSLSATGPVLAGLQARGAIICTVNTALKAVNRYVVPDVVLARESVDVSSHLAYPAGLRVLDLSANPTVWAAARAMGPTAWFIPAASQFFELAAQLGVRPLFAGPAALTAMVALCEQWGAARIILVGCDLALADDGTSYADGSAFSGQRAVIDAMGVATNEGPGFATKLEQHAKAGIAAPPTVERTIEVERYGGGLIRTTAQWYDQVPWLRTFSERQLDLVCVDATDAGARKGGEWMEIPAWRLPAAFMHKGAEPRRYSMDHRRVEQAIEHLKAQCEATVSLANTLLDPEGCIAMVPGLLSGLDVVEAASAGDMLTNLEAQGHPVDKIRTAYGQILPWSAGRLLGILSR